MQNNAVRGQESRTATVTAAAAARSVHRNMCTTSHLSYRKIVLKAECVYFAHICEYIPSCKYANICERDAARCSCIIFVFDSRGTVWVHSYRFGECVRCYMEMKSVKRASKRVRERVSKISLVVVIIISYDFHFNWYFNVWPNSFSLFRVLGLFFPME